MIFNNPKMFCVGYCGQQADSTFAAPTTMRGGGSYLPLDNILPFPAGDMIDDILEESDHDAETRCSNLGTFPPTEKHF